MNDPLQAAMLLPETEAPPDLGAAALDEILAVRIGPDGEVDRLPGHV